MAGFDWGAAAGSVSAGGGMIGGIYTPFLEREWSSKASRHAYERAVNAYKHRYQWAVEDLRKAGLNPALAYTQGVAGASPHVEAAKTPSFDVDGSFVGKAVSAAKAAKAMRDQLEILRNQRVVSEEAAKRAPHETEKAAADAHKSWSEKFLLDAQASETSARTFFLDEETRRARAETSLKITDEQYRATQLAIERSKLPSARARAEFDESAAGQFLIKMQHSGKLMPLGSWLYK